VIKKSIFEHSKWRLEFTIKNGNYQNLNDIYMKIEKYNIIIEKGIHRIIAEGPIQTVVYDGEHGGYEHFICNMRIENNDGKMLSSILNKVPFSSMRRSGADLDELYTMEGFYLINDTFGYLRSESWTSLTNPSEWCRSMNFDISNNLIQPTIIEVDEFLKDCETTYNVIQGENIDILSKYLNELMFFEKEGFLPLQDRGMITWDKTHRILLIYQSK